MVEERTLLMTPAETAEYLRVSVHTLKKWRLDVAHPLKYYKLGKKVMYSRHMCEKFLEARCSNKN